MNTLRRMIYRDIAVAVGFVTLAFLALFFFFDLVDELRWTGSTYTARHAVLAVALDIPSHIYELLPITVLIGTIFVMARMAQTSEFTIMRTSGLGPWRALGLLASIGVAFVALTFVIGDYISPLGEKTSELVRAQRLGQLSTGRTGAWLREKHDGGMVAVNVGAIGTDGGLQNLRAYRFDDQGRLTMQWSAKAGSFLDDTHWQLSEVTQRVYHIDGRSEARVETRTLPQLDWPTQITRNMVAAAVLKPDQMSTYDLFQYVRHLQANGQTTQRYEIELWRKVFYPISCLVMVVLALPFAYLHFRSGGIAGYVFAGVMAGISFFMLNNVFGYAGNLQNWSPMITAAAPGLIYSMLSLAAFTWLVLRR
ncbi:MAG: LPS export ABC transporter permease LptG [Comamonas sp.]